MRPEFYDVKIEKVDDKTIKFILKQPYSPFLENLTVGILPKHLWGNLSSDEFSLSQYNVEPVGSGPYEVGKMETLQKNIIKTVQARYITILNVPIKLPILPATVHFFHPLLHPNPSLLLQQTLLFPPHRLRGSVMGKGEWYIQTHLESSAPHFAPDKGRDQNMLLGVKAIRLAFIIVVVPPHFPQVLVHRESQMTHVGF